MATTQEQTDNGGNNGERTEVANGVTTTGAILDDEEEEITMEQLETPLVPTTATTSSNDSHDNNNNSNNEVNPSTQNHQEEEEDLENNNANDRSLRRREESHLSMTMSETETTRTAAAATSTNTIPPPRCFWCARLTLGVLYLAIFTGMLFFLLIGRGLDQSFGPGKGLCHEESLCIFFVSWAIMACYMGFEGLSILCFAGNELHLGYRPQSSILKALRPTVPLAVLILYGLLAFCYLDIRNHLVYRDPDGETTNQDYDDNNNNNNHHGKYSGNNGDDVVDDDDYYDFVDSKGYTPTSY